MGVSAGVGKEGGIIMVDALVAVVIVSLMIAICLGTLKITRGLSRSALDNREAAVALAAAVEAVPRAVGHYHGSLGQFVYEAKVEEDKVQGLRLCRIEASLRTRPKGRVHRLSATRWCDRHAEAVA
ncbi:hypothetical protein ABI_12930 [Asticcacaulis biprosthecium C19]|uniref:Uncharacterized protein n=2 Tax=Asticcacaulis biprosthecium TaxID=76891 RepID=F4QHW8_9CAUL|nr:hypothetical protein ABI_12930 [Asticcacaulis biprosthecium C19]